MRSRRIQGVFLALCLLTLTLALGEAKGSSGFELGQGERIRAVAWESADRVLLLAETKDGYGLRRLEPRSGDLEIVASPRSFTLLKPSQKDGRLQLSPGGRWLLYTEAPQEHAEIRLWRVTRDKIEDVPVRLPQNVVAGETCWSDDDGDLFIGAAPYLYPDQEYSILRLDLDRGELAGVAIKANIDNITQLEFAPGAGRLAAVCGGFRGEYPMQPVAVRVELANGEMSLLHSECEGMQLRALGDGSILLARAAGLGSRPETWILPPKADDLVQAETQCGTDALLDSDREGSWLGWLEGVKAGSGKLILQRVSDAVVLEGPDDCCYFRFSPYSPVVIATLAQGEAISVISLAP